MPDIRELGQRVKAKYPGVYDAIDDAELGRKVKAKYPGAYDQFTDTPQAGLLSRIGGNISNAAQQGYEGLKDKAAALGEIIGGVTTGNFYPLIEAGKQIGGSIAGGQALLNYNPVEYLNQQALIEQTRQQQAARRVASGDTSFQRRAQLQAELERRAMANDPSLAGRLVRGGIREGIKLLPTVVAGAVSGGSVPVIAATQALSSFDNPADLPVATVLSALPVPSARAVKGLFDKGAAQAVEAEVAQGATQMALPGMEAAVKEAAGQVEKSVARKVADNIAAAYHVPRAVMASGDVSAPFRQGAIFTISNPRMAARATVEMFRAFKTRNFEQIASEIGANVDAQLGQRFGLHLGTQAKEGLKRGEEAFISRFAGKIPGVAGSERAYTSYLDVLRVQKFSQYKKLIDGAGLSQAKTQEAYKAAATWINYATGRGTLGAGFEKAMPLLNTFFFAPRYAASRLNILNPFYYAKNATTEAGRIILKQQAKELFAFGSVVASTMALAKYGFGADVTLNPNDSDFGKIKLGNYRYDLGAGALQAVKLVYKTSEALAHVARGDKAERGKSVGDVWRRYSRSKLGPAPSWFVDATEGRTYVGREYSTGRAIAERALPLQWKDWVEAGWEDGIGGILKATPGAVGINVERHEPQKQKRGR